MPTYHYKCDGCKNEYEAEQKMSDPAYTECPECQGELHRVPQSFGFKLIGPGFHCNEYPSQSWRHR